MSHQHSHMPLCRLAVAILVSLPLFASAQTIRGFSITPQNAASATPSKERYRTVAAPVAGRYIVVLKTTTAKLANEGKSALPPISEVAEDMAKTHGASVLYSYNYVLRGFAVQASDNALAQLLADTRVEYVEEDGVVTGNPTQSNATWGLDRIDQRTLPLNGTYNYNTSASNVRAYVLDSGLRASHHEFAGRVGAGFPAINDGFGTDDCHGHGTHVAGTIGGITWGVAKGVAIHPVRVLDCNNEGSWAGIIAGLDWVRTNHVKPSVANMSLGGPPNTSADAAVNTLINAGVTVVIAAGNNAGDACQRTPARVSNAITVGATDMNDARSSFSNFGSCLDLFAPGTSITSAWNTGDTATNTINGTSMAAPHVAGAAALYLAGNPTATPAQVTTALLNNATPGRVTNAGNGSPNRLLFTSNTPPPANRPLTRELSGLWYEPETSGQGFNFEIRPEQSIVFGGWYTYAGASSTSSEKNTKSGPRQRWFSVTASYTPGQTSSTMTIYRNTGGNFDAPPTTIGVPVGTATLTFQSCTSGRFDYELDLDGTPRSGSIPLTRLGSEEYCNQGWTPTFRLSQQGISPALDGAWYDPNTSGQGFQFHFLPQNGNLVFLAWYTYDLNGELAGSEGQRWYTVSGAYTPGSAQAFNLPLFQTSGGNFDAIPTVTGVQVGTASVSFSSCSAATLTYNIPGRPSRTISLIRLTGGANCQP